MSIIEDNASREAGAAVPSTPPRENLYRINPDIGLTRSTDGGMPTMTGHFAVWDQWTEIRSAYEGNFMERFAPEAMTRTLSINTPQVLFQHGKDPQVGDKVLGAVSRVEPDATGAYYEVQLLDTTYNRDLIPGLEAGLYGASFRFSVLKEDVVQKPKRSEFNPRGIPERTVTEAKVMEFGPVTFPAYSGATAGIRSITDEFVLAPRLQDPEELGRILSYGDTRFDNNDIGCLAQMVQLASCYIGDQDEPDDQPAAREMERIVVSLVGLLQGETTEPEPDEPDDEPAGMPMPTMGMNSEVVEGAERQEISVSLFVDGEKRDPEPSEATTHTHRASDPEPSEATTRSSTSLFWFVEPPKSMGAK